MDLINLSLEELKRLETETAANVSKYKAGQLAKKYLMNGEYGALGSPYFRYFDIKLASAITLSGQLALRWIENYLMNHPKQKKYKWEIIYEDTDSIYVDLHHVFDRISKKIGDEKKAINKLNDFSKKVVQPLIDEGYEKLAKYVGANENRMFMKQEKISSVGLWTGKKKYALMVHDNEGVRYPKPKLKVKGIETVRSSTPKFVRDRLENVLTLIMTDESKLMEFINDTKSDFFKMPPEEIAFSVGVNTLKKYETVIKDKINNISMLHYKKRTPIGVRAAIIHNKYVIYNDLFTRFPEIQQGEKIKYVYLKLPNPVHENIIGFSRTIPDREKFLEYIDYKTQFEKSFMNPITNITEKIGMILRDGDEVDLNELF